MTPDRRCLGIPALCPEGTHHKCCPAWRREPAPVSGVSPEAAVQMRRAAALLDVMAETVEAEIAALVPAGWVLSCDKIGDAADALRAASARVLVDARGCWPSPAAPEVKP